MNDCNSPKYSLSDNDIKDVFLELEKSLFIGAKKETYYFKKERWEFKSHTIHDFNKPKEQCCLVSLKQAPMFSS